ncbi:MAG: methyltransferase [Pseudomonadota bacterium]
MRLLPAVCLPLLLLNQFAIAQPEPILSSEATRQAIQAAMASDIRPAEDKARDVERKPVEVLSFFRLEQDMRVIEILPFGGWFTKIIAPVVRDNGMLYTVQPELGDYSDALNPVLQLPGMDKVVKLNWNGRAPEDRNPFVGSGTWDVEPVDLVVTFRNYHNFGYDDRMTINKSAFDALKPGGLYGIVDHTRRHMEPDNRENGRRMDPVLVIKEVQDSGFVFVDYTDVKRRPDDELLYEVGNPDVTGKTDRFTMLFRKP